jgi:hypothetical protein
MHNPYVSQYVKAVKSANSFVMIAATDIPGNTIIEICPTITVSSRASIILAKANHRLQNRFLIDQSVIDKEYDIFTQLGELELEKKLNSGELNSEEYSDILRSRINFNSLLDAKSHVLMLGNGLLYETSETPNMVLEYHSDTKLCIFKTVQYVSQGQLLTYYN